MSYFVTKQELVEKKKEPIIAFILALFLGIFGTHRFYMKRKLSGWIILITTFGTLFLSLFVIIPLIIIELIQLAVTSYHMHPPKKHSHHQPTTVPPTPEKPPKEISIRETPAIALTTTDPIAATHTRNISTATATNSSSRPSHTISDFVTTPEQKVSHVSRPAKTSSDDVKIYDVSDIATPPIQRQPTTPQSPPVNTWTKRLDLPCEYHHLQTPQISQAAIEIYEKLAEKIDQDLRSQHSSLEEMNHSLSTMGFLYHGSMLSTLFFIAQAEVGAFYSPNTRSGAESYTYQLLEERLDKTYVQQLKTYVRNLAHRLPPPDPLTMQYFGLTQFGTPVVWWDTTGELRKTYTLPDTIGRLMNITNPRRTRLYDIIAIRAAIILHYYQILMTLDQQRTATPGWSRRMTKYLTNVFDEKQNYIAYTPNLEPFLTYLLKLSEQAIREHIPYVRALDTKNEMAFIARSIPKPAVTALMATVNNVPTLHLTAATIAELRTQSPGAWREDVQDIHAKTIDQVITLLTDYKDLDDLPKVAKEIVKNHNEAAAKLLAIYQLNSQKGVLDAWFEKKLLSLIHPGRVEAYQTLVGKKEKLSRHLATTLLSLQKAPRKRVVLDEARLARARSDHAHAVASVEDYIGDVEDANDDQQTTEDCLIDIPPAIAKEEPVAPTPSTDVVLTNDQKDFIQQILQSDGGLEKPYATTYARNHRKTLNSYLQSLNQVLYDTFEDQVILEQDDKIRIDKEYEHAMKELR